MAFLATETIRTENVYSIQLTPCPVLLKLSHAYLTSATTIDQDSSQLKDSRQKRGFIITVILCLVVEVHHRGKADSCDCRTVLIFRLLTFSQSLPLM